MDWQKKIWKLITKCKILSLSDHYTYLFCSRFYRCPIMLIFYIDKILDEIYEMNDSDHYFGPIKEPTMTQNWIKLDRTKTG